MDSVLLDITGINGFLTDAIASSVVFTVLAAVILVSFLIKYTRRLASHYLRHIALAVFFVGVVLYWIGFYDGNIVATGFRAVLSSLEMFVSHSDLLEIEQHQMVTGHHVTTPLYMTVFALTHFLAVMVSAILIAHLLGYRFISWCRMLMDRILFPKRHLYVFFGFNNASFILAGNIVKNCSDKKSRRMVFVMPPSDEGHFSRFTFSHFFSAHHGNEHISKVEDLDAVIACSSVNPGNMIPNRGNFFDNIGLGNLRKLVESAIDVKLFFLSDSESDNISGAVAAKNSLAAYDKGKYTIFCHARRDSVNTLIEEAGLADNIDIRVIDSSFLSVEQLKSNPGYLPVSFVDVDADATVVSPFTAMVVGFGETGEDAVRFLYEFGAFAGKDSRRSPFKCYVVDRDCGKHEGRFYMNVPALVGSDEVVMKPVDYRSSGFWEWLRGVITEMNYIVVAVGDDNEGINLAVDIYNFACRYRNNNLGKFKIFVRSYSAGNEQKLEDAARSVNEKNRECIVVFGQQKRLFTNDAVICDRTLEEARSFYDSYRETYNRTAEYKDDNTWDDRHDINKLSEKRWKQGREVVPQFLIQEVRRKESQDIANSRHVTTKLALLAATGFGDRVAVCYRNRRGEKDGIYYVDSNGKRDEAVTTVMRNLAICEHLRWNASHELLGYVTNTEDRTSCNEITKQHNCIVAWNELDSLSSTDYKLYDYLVVETSISLRDSI